MSSGSRRAVFDDNDTEWVAAGCASLLFYVVACPEYSSLYASRCLCFYSINSDKVQYRAFPSELRVFCIVVNLMRANWFSTVQAHLTSSIIISI